MGQRKWTKVLAVVVCALLGVVLAPGCDSLGLGGEEGGGGGGGLDALSEADPTQVEIAKMEAGYMAYMALLL